MSTVTQALDANATTNLYEFTSTQDWFSSHKPAWQTLFPIVSSRAPRVLEIGSWEGRSAVFILTTLCATSGEVVCIDHFDLMATAEGRERHRKLTHNLSLTGRPARVLPQFSVPALYTLLGEEMSKEQDAGFDWIYIDGSHRSDDTLLDAELAWRLARLGCIFIFDDYNWPEQPLDSPHHPRRGIDAFLAVHREEYKRLSTNPEQYQMILQKTTPMRIGFLLEPSRDRLPYDALEYGINVALTIDSAYAMTAAVTLRSVVEYTKGRITFYIVDCGLLAEDKKKIEASLPARPNITLLFVALPADSLSSTMGAVWAKRVLYLDADVLVRKDLKELWNTNLGGYALAAVPDVGFPMGHPGVPKVEYFNVGVLLIDLAKTRSTLQDLGTCCREMAQSTFHDQDALNVHFKTDCVKLSLTWNAQGLGTYAECVTADREMVCLEDMKDPAIVHFTGPIHPPVEVVLNPYVQPYTAKPWGYAGAPGHPYEREWWDMLEKTAWKGWKETTDCKEAREKARRRH
ncbi:glycosyltransferase family 8 protein [Chiua virens]|nr:glycosyltransferase family 8 protein [Chiua virens]